MTISCFREEKKSEVKPPAGRSNGDFIVVNLSGQSQTEPVSKDWSVPAKKTYDFRACIRTKLTNAILGPGQEFKIVKPSKKLFFAKTDEKGCINWKESIDFNVTLQSKYVELLRTIKGNNIYKGEFPVRIGINPWSEFRNEQNLEVLNLDEVSIPDSQIVSGNDSKLAFSGLYENTPGQDLLIDDQPTTSIKVLKNKNQGKLVRFTLKVRPFIEPLNISGRPVPYYFKQGKFKVYPQLVANYLGKENKKLLLLNLLPQDLKISKNGFLVYQKELILNKEVTMGQIQLALKVEALNAPMHLNSYEGLHEVSDFQNLFGPIHMPIQIRGPYSNKLFDYSKFVSSAENFEKLKELRLAFNLKPFRFEPLDIRFVKIAPGETATRRTVIYRVETRVVDTITGAPLKKHPFRVEKEVTGKIEMRSSLTGGLEEVVHTDDNGILKWTDEINHLYYIAEQFYYPKVNITHLHSDHKETLKMAINPWNSGWTFGSDLRGREIKYEEMNKQEKRNSTFMVDAFRYQTIRFRYEIDRFMTLNVKKAVVMAMDPLVQRYTIEEGRKGGEPLRDGIYLVKIALVKYFIDPFKNGTKLYSDSNSLHGVRQTSDNVETKKGEYITVIKKLLRVQGGRITTPLEFSMRDLRMMSIRSNIMVQIETVDEQKLLRDNLMDRKLRLLKDEYEAYHSKDMTEEDRKSFLLKNDELFLEEREKLITRMQRELDDLKRHRSQLADKQAERHKALLEFEKKIKSERSLEKRKSDREKLFAMDEKDFEEYITNVRSNLDQMEKKFSDYWRKWNEDMGIPSNEIKDWIKNEEDLESVKPYNRKKYENPDKERIGLGQNKSVYDYLASLQTFMEDFGIPDSIGKEDLEAMRLNNYTQNPAAPFIDLDLYRVNAGVPKRTFIGPCTLIANDNMSEMRPTDTIDETFCDRIDCSQKLIDFGFEVDNSEFEESEYHGAIKPFKMMHVDDIIKRYIKHEKNYIHGMRALSQIGNLLETYNLEYTSLNDNKVIEGPKKFKNNCKVNIEATDQYDPNRFDKCYIPANERVVPIDTFLNYSTAHSTKELIEEYFKYKYFDHGKAEEGLINELPDLASKASDASGEVLLPSKIREIIRNVFTSSDNRELYLELFEGNQHRPFTKLRLKEILHSREKKPSLINAVELCGILTEKVSSSLRENGFLQVNPRMRGANFQRDYFGSLVAKRLRKKCLKSIEFDPQTGYVKNSGIAFDKRYRILKTGKYVHNEGKNMNLNIAYDVTIGSAEVLQDSTAFEGQGNIGYGGKFGGGGIALARQVSKAEVDEIAHGTSVNAATFLVVQQATMQIEIEKFERCFTASLHPKLFNDLYSKEDLKLKEQYLKSDKDVSKTLTKGIMVCEGEYNKEPEQIIENYYYVTQHFTAGDMLDEGNLLNHIWLLPLRGRDDFNNFMTITNAREVNSKGEVIKEEDTPAYPLERLKDTYEQILPSFPGMYTLQDH